MGERVKGSRRRRAEEREREMLPGGKGSWGKLRKREGEGDDVGGREGRL